MHLGTKLSVVHPSEALGLLTGKTSAEYISTRDVHLMLGECVYSNNQDDAPLLLLKFVPPPPTLARPLQPLGEAQT